MAGAVVSMLGVLLVLSQGRWRHLAALRLVPGDLYILLAVLAWSVYSWMLVGTDMSPRACARDWAGLPHGADGVRPAWSGLFAAGEWAAGAMVRRTGAGGWPPRWSSSRSGLPLLAFRCWGAVRMRRA